MDKVKFIILGMTFILIGCQSKLIETSEGDFSLYLIPVNIPDIEKIYPELKESFKISDKESIGIIKNSWIFRKTKKKFIPFYIMFVVKNGVVAEKFSFSRDLKIVSKEGINYHFKPDLLLDHKQKFTKFDSYTLQFDNFQKARSYKNLIKNYGVFVIPPTTAKQFPWENYNGKAILIRDLTNENKICPVNNKSISAELEKFIEGFEIERLEFSKSEDSLIIYLYCNTYIDKLPEFYTINNNYDENSLVSYIVSGVDYDKIQILSAKYDSIMKVESY